MILPPDLTTTSSGSESAVEDVTTGGVAGDHRHVERVMIGFGAFIYTLLVF